MGLLDDAIRQHLELKRRHGADPSDVARLEHEALGPVEREDALAVPEAGHAPTKAADPGDHAADAAVAHEEEAAYEEAELEAEEDWADRGADVARVPEPDPEPVEPLGGSVRLDADADLPPTTVTPPRDRARAPAEPLEPAADDEASGEHDELEETPEFLQETPEHDRLWFEQKPPRDFDF